jgi:hypothetical protein
MALAAQMAQAEADKTPIASMFAAHSVHEPVHESWHLRGRYDYVALPPAVGVAPSVCSLLVVL